MIQSPSQTERIHRAINRETATRVAVVKRCACQRATTSKQLAQHGKCIACLLADRVATLEPGDIDMLRFMLGATAHHPRVRWGFRNEYHVYRRDIPASQRLLRAGFITIAGSVGICQKFRATAAGCKLAGLGAAGTRSALGGQP